MNSMNTTIVICCAGMGTRLGIGTTKALLGIAGKPLIIRQLELLKDYDDIRIVVGFQAEKVIDVVTKYRKDIVFAFNYDYETTGVAVSLNKGMLGARQYTIAIDGDLLVNPDDFKAFLEYKGECIAATEANSTEPIWMVIDNNKVVKFSKEKGVKEWPGLAKIQTSKLKAGYDHVFEMIQELLPMDVVEVRAREIDTPEDYEKAVSWLEDGCMN